MSWRLPAAETEVRQCRSQLCAWFLQERAVCFAIVPQADERITGLLALELLVPGKRANV